MFDHSFFPEPLTENLFQTWLEKGRLSKVGYQYLLIIWSELEVSYSPVYAESKEKMNEYERYGESHQTESLVAVYDLYSESRLC
ncbi:MAG: hypothetical protein AAF519_06965 [Bacteroidota bacterium]